MRASKEKAAEHRDQIVDVAGRLFRAKGFDGAGVAEIMAAADLTHGGFYGHFGSKDALAAQASKKALEKSAQVWRRIAAESPDAPFRALLEHYLRPSHRDEPGTGCALAALGADAARQGKPVRNVFGDGLDELVEILAAAVPGTSKAARRRKAVAALAQLAGAVMLSRAVGDRDLSDEILKAARADLLDSARF